MKNHQSIPWDLQPTTEITVAQLDQDALFDTLDEAILNRRVVGSRARDPMEALMRLRLLSSNMLTRAAVVLFCQDPLPYYPQCLLSLARFKGQSRVPVDSRQIHGNLFQLLSAAQCFVSRYLDAPSQEASAAQESFGQVHLLPAIHEAILNALCHRDYSIVGGCVSVVIYDDRIEVVSHGVLPSELRLDDLQREHEAYPRNERIFNVLFWRGMISAMGMGSQSMRSHCRLAHFPQPQFIQQGHLFGVRFKTQRLPEKTAYTQVQQALATKNIKPRHREVLLLLQKHDTLRSSQLKILLSQVASERTLRRDLNHLAGIGLVERIGEGPSTCWTVLPDAASRAIDLI